MVVAAFDQRPNDTTPPSSATAITPSPIAIGRPARIGRRAMRRPDPLGHSVLAYVAAAVENYQWLQLREMLDGLGMTETAPGPLIMVLRFVCLSIASRHVGPG